MSKVADILGSAIMDPELMTSYFDWLCDLVGANEGDWTYTSLLRCLHHINFDVFMVSHDENRAEDGINLRWEFAEETGDWCEKEPDDPCTVLEMLIALSRRMEEILADPNEGDRSVMFFWEMIGNLDLEDCTDKAFERADKDLNRYIKDVIDKLLWRRYTKRGRGGLFPVKDSWKDQRSIEIWYQMQQYICENYEI